MEYAKLAAMYARLEATTKRLEMTDILAAFLKDVPADVLDKVVHLTAGRIHPDYVGLELGLAEKLVLRVLGFTTGLDGDRLEALYKELGDLGLVAERAVATKKQQALFREALTAGKVWANLDAIARAKGAGSQDRKIKLLADLLHAAAPEEAKYLVRTVVGKMRLGIADMTLVDALAVAFATREDRDRVERAYNVSSDLGEVAKVLAAEGLDGLDAIRLTLGRPIRAMLCERLPSLEEIFARLGGACALEYKYDGLRMQAHIAPDTTKIFSRHLEDVTDQFPEIRDGLRDALATKAVIVEGEAVPVDVHTGEFLPFQQVSHRRGRKYELDAMAKEYPVTLFLFDCLYRDGVDLTTEPYATRREVLEAAVKEGERIRLAATRITDDLAAAEAFFEEAVQAGCEGLVAKALPSRYEAGARGYQWIKYKREYKAELTDTVDLVAVGAFAGRGRRAGTYGALLCAAYDADEDVFRTICKLGTGFDDVTLFALPERFAPHRVSQRHARVDSELEADVWFEPAVVVEVLGAEITLSPVHTCARDAVKEGAGLAIRFPRFTGRWREDKKPEDATTQAELLAMYEGQLKTVKG